MTTFRSRPIFHFFVFTALLASLLGSAVMVTPAYASAVIVTKLADTNDGVCDSDCSLREAIATAGIGDTITFDPSLSAGTIHLGSTLTLSQNVTIDGSALASQIAISGDGNVQVFSIGTGATVILNSLTITNGNTNASTGGGIYNSAGATLTVTNSTISGNTTVGPGGGIKNDGTLTVTNSTFSGNSAGLSGGGIRNAGALTVSNSTFSSNTATGSGGGIYNLNSYSLTITNSTFSGNSAGSQGGGIYHTNSGTMNYSNTIIANSGSGGDCVGDSDSVIGTNTNNLVQDGGCSASVSGNPGLDALANNGGPTQTFALIDGSPAIDTGDDTTCAASPVGNLDQRGVTRPVGTHCDIGAYEGSIPDIVAPSVNSFTATSPGTSLNIPITAFTVSDNVAVTGYLITESATPPSAGDTGWTGSAPGTHTVSSLGDYTLYPWAKDAAGNVSSVYGSPAAVAVCYSSVTVSSNADSGAGTLRQAINDTCSGGSIDFYTALAGSTIHLASPLILSKNVTIDGSALAGQITISGDNAVRVFSVGGVTATLNSLTITNGFNGNGGGIFVNNGTLTVTNSTLSNNSATVGGGIYVNSGSTATITNSTIVGNSAGLSGSGIYNDGTLTVMNSTLSNNNSANNGGGITSTGSMTITSSTFSDNSVPGFGADIYNNGGILNYANTILANASGGGADCVNGGTGTIGTNTNNLVEDGSCSSGGTNLLSIDPNLGPRADNGGSTQTFALLAGSPAINAGNAIICASSPVTAFDQRGVARPQGGQCDIGAYEYEAIVTSNADNGAGTLRQAIADAGDGDTILFDSSLSGSTIHLASTLNIVQNMTIDGSTLASKITISGDNAVRVFYIHSGMTVTLDSLIITKGNGTDPNIEDSITGGGGIQNNSGNTGGVVLTVINSIITGNSADTGGGIYNRDQSTLTIINSTISGNTATGNGGGVYSDGTLTVTSSTISGNSAGGDGGGIRDGSITTLTNSTLSGNSATGSGGAIRNAGNLTAKNNTLSGNSSSGGSIYSDNTFNATNNIIANSTSGGDCAGEIDGNTNNLVKDGSCSGGGVNYLSGDPFLGPLADNGGPTQTFALGVGSPAIDAGDDATCAAAPVNDLDQRDITRPLGAHCDIGAYEGSNDFTAPTVTGFSAVSPSLNLSIPLPFLSFTATDNVAVSGYKITETSTPPLSSASGWTASPPSMYTVGSDGSYTLYPWAMDAAGNVSAVFGSPVSVLVDATAPTVSSTTLVTTSPTAKANLQFLVTFSEPVTGISTADFSLTITGISGGSVTSVSGSGSVYTVTVNSGSGNGTLRLDIPNGATITDLVGNMLAGRPYTGGQVYTINKTLTYTSAGAQDGWMLESSETSNTGGTLNSAAATFILGDGTADKQYRSILSFNTTSLPDNTTITGVTLKIKRPTTGFLTGNNNPFSWGQGLKVDVCKLFFGTTSALQLSDFNANNTTNCKLLAATFGSTPSANWYSANVLSSAFAKVNMTGLTQFRLRFAKDDNDDMLADYLSFYSGNAAAANRPQLVITYSVP